MARGTGHLGRALKGIAGGFADTTTTLIVDRSSRFRL